jgi:hypothetical protein
MSVMPSSLTLRVRSLVWFVTGAALAIATTLVFVHAWSVDAAPGDADTTFVPVTPCRLFDTRPAPDTVGPRSTPLAAGVAHTQSVRGTNGNCTVPNDATGVALNLTATNPTAQSNVRVFPADAPAPLVSNLNFVAGQKPVANKVDVKLSADGKIKLLNLAGTVNVLGDVVGYYTPTSLVQLQQQITTLGNRMTALENSMPFTGGVSGSQSLALDWLGSTVRAITVTAPVAGTITVDANVGLRNGNTGAATVACSITTGTTLDTAHSMNWFVDTTTTGEVEYEVFAATRMFFVPAGSTATYRLVCRTFQNGQVVSANNSALNATFAPNP